ncbi:MAG: bifunctional oligoribonuclease/PAP phosphatase NrnA [Acidobacteria bacterium]|nr:MAG: bifunctional oligoribonuclease/PAP phosphatase NrnA [Acidobacteriota bacterium]
MMDQVLKQIEQREAFVLTSHARPDGDAIGSLLALYQMLRQLGKTSQVVMSDAVPLIYGPLPYADVILHSSQIPDGAPATAIILETCLYTAVLTDTGAFCYAGTDERAFELAQQLVRRGANPVDIAHHVYFSNPTSKMRLLGNALSNLHREGALAYMHISSAEMERSGGLDEDCEGLVNYALSIQGVEVALFFRELADGRYRVSLRSKGQVNVAAIAEQFGGGGHACASGCAVSGPLSRSLELILAQLGGVFSPGGRGPEATA